MAQNSDDKEMAAGWAVDLMAGARFKQLAEVIGDVAAAERATEVADVFVVWLRRLAGAQILSIIIEEIDTGAVVSVSPPGGPGSMTNIDSSQQVRYVLTGKDDRGFDVDGDLSARAGTDGVVTLVTTQATDGTASGKDETVATFAGLGTTTVEIFDSANPDVVLAVDTIVANPGALAAVELVATVEEIPAPPPVL